MKVPFSYLSLGRRALLLLAFGVVCFAIGAIVGHA